MCFDASHEVLSPITQTLTILGLNERDIEIIAYVSYLIDFLSSFMHLSMYSDSSHKLLNPITHTLTILGLNETDTEIIAYALYP